MPMVDLGEKRKMFEGPMLSQKEKPKIRYPNHTFPLKLLGKDAPQKGKDVIVVLKGKIIGFEDTEHRQTFEIETRQAGIYKSMNEIPKGKDAG